MKDLFEKVLRFIPGYIESFLSLVGAPKRYIREASAREQLSVEKGLTFFAVSFALGWVLKTPLMRLDPMVELGADAVFALAMALGYGSALLIAWKVVGGKGTSRQLFVVFLHYIGVLLLISGLTYLTIMGALRAVDPVLYKELTEALYNGTFLTLTVTEADRLFAKPAFLIAELILAAGVLAAVAWLYSGWGAYRNLSGVSRSRSALAAVLFLVLSIPVSAILTLVANTLIK